MSDEDIKAEVTEVVRGMYGKHINPPTDIFVPRWHSDPLFRGTYRYINRFIYMHEVLTVAN